MRYLRHVSQLFSSVSGLIKTLPLITQWMKRRGVRVEWEAAINMASSCSMLQDLSWCVLCVSVYRSPLKWQLWAVFSSHLQLVQHLNSVVPLSQTILFSRTRTHTHTHTHKHTEASNSYRSNNKLLSGYECFESDGSPWRTVEAWAQEKKKKYFASDRMH
jgi:hypothetical protein